MADEWRPWMDPDGARHPMETGSKEAREVIPTAPRHEKSPAARASADRPYERNRLPVRPGLRRVPHPAAGAGPPRLAAAPRQRLLAEARAEP